MWLLIKIRLLAWCMEKISVLGVGREKTQIRCPHGVVGFAKKLGRWKKSDGKEVEIGWKQREQKTRRKTLDRARSSMACMLSSVAWDEQRARVGSL
jgi:hypothetical protein